MVIKALHISLIFGMSCFAQDIVEPNSFIKKYDDKVIASLYFFDISNNFQLVSSSDGITNKLDLEPNRRALLGASLSYKFIDISYGFSPKIIHENKDNDRSKLINFDTRFYSGRWMQSLSFINQTGFTATQSGIEVPFQRLRSTKIGGTTSYVFNDKFSIRCLTNQKEWQARTAGSFVPIFSFFYTNLDLNDSSPQTTSDIYTITLSPSYFHNFVLGNHFLIAVGASAGVGLTSIDREVHKLHELSANMKIGYSSDSFFSFIRANSSNFVQDDRAEFQLLDNLTTLKFVVGYRFSPPKKVMQFDQKIRQKISK